MTECIACPDCDGIGTVIWAPCEPAAACNTCRGSGGVLDREQHKMAMPMAIETAVQGAVSAERKWFEAQLVAIKHELNGMALIGVKPMWGSLIGRLEQMIADAKAR